MVVIGSAVCVLMNYFERENRESEGTVMGQNQEAKT